MTRIASALEPSLGSTGDARFLDVGCGRGGPAIHLSDRLGVEVTGVDVVTHGLELARENARRAGVAPSFVAGDAVTLPFVDGAFDACSAIDAIVYVPEKRAVFEELYRVTRSGGAVVVSDLVVADGRPASDRRHVAEFADAWDMPPIPTRARYLETVGSIGLSVESAEDISSHSIERFRKWSGLSLLAVDRAGGLLQGALGRWGLDAETVIEQIRLAHEAIPHLRHVLVRARRR